MNSSLNDSLVFFATHKNITKQNAFFDDLLLWGICQY
jgi:hypothetical protein